MNYLVVSLNLRINTRYVIPTSRNYTIITKQLFAKKVFIVKRSYNINAAILGSFSGYSPIRISMRLVISNPC